jgi:hypothetical protein
MHPRNRVNPRLVYVGAKVPAEDAEAIAQLADEGDRTVRREIRRAIREHLERSEAAGGTSSSPPSVSPVERSGPEEASPAVDPLQPAGPT